MPFIQQSSGGGIQIQRTPWDDAELQNVGAQNQFNLASMQNDWENQRFGAGQSQARALNQDNLNFGVWKDKQDALRYSAGLTAQQKLAEIMAQHQEKMQQTGFQHEEANWRNRELPFQQRMLANADLQAQDLRDQAALRHTDMDRRQKLSAAMQDPTIRAKLEQGDTSGIAQYMNPDQMLDFASRTSQNRAQAQEATARNLANQAAELRKRGDSEGAKRMETQIPEAFRYVIAPADATMDPRSLAEATDTKTTGHLEQVAAQLGQEIRGMGRPDDPQTAAQGLVARVRAYSTLLAQQHNLDPREVYTFLMNRMKGKARTGFSDWIRFNSQYDLIEQVEAAQ